MRRTVYRRILMGLIVCNLVALVTYGYYLLKTSVPDEMKILLGQEEEFDFFLRIAHGAATISEESQRLGIKLPACYKRFERIRDRLQQTLGKYYKY